MKILAHVCLRPSAGKKQEVHLYDPNPDKPEPKRFNHDPQSAKGRKDSTTKATKEHKGKPFCPSVMKILAYVCLRLSAGKKQEFHL
jgi:hypothetical protein